MMSRRTARRCSRKTDRGTDSDGSEEATIRDMLRERRNWCILPFGLYLLPGVPCFDDLEKMLQMIGLMCALLLGCVVGSSGGVPEKDCDKDTDYRLRVVQYLQETLNLCTFDMVLVFILYCHLVLYVDQGSSRSEAKQIELWWRGSCYLAPTLITLIVIVFVYSTVKYITAINIQMYCLAVQKGSKFEHGWGMIAGDYTIAVYITLGYLLIHASFCRLLTAPRAKTEQDTDVQGVQGDAEQSSVST